MSPRPTSDTANSACEHCRRGVLVDGLYHAGKTTSPESPRPLWPCAERAPHLARIVADHARRAALHGG